MSIQGSQATARQPGQLASLPDMDESTELAITFFTSLTVLANIAVLALAVLVVAARVTGDSPVSRAWAALRAELSAVNAVGVAWLVAAVAMAGSLYFSEGAGFVPCRLCWVQRGLMYPLVVVLAGAGWAAVASHEGLYRWLRRLIMGMAAAGAVVAFYHVLIERYPSLESATSCDPSNPCSLIWFKRLGFVTLPYMSLSAFVLIFTMLLVAGNRSQVRDDMLLRQPSR